MILELSYLILCFLNFYHYIKASFSLPSKTGFSKNSRSQKKYICFNDRIAVNKLINTMICICKILRDVSTAKNEDLYYFGLEMLSSHPVEKLFGQYRNHFDGKYECKTAFRFAVRAAISIEFQSNAEVSFSINERDNYGGMYLHYKNTKDEEFDIKIIPTKYSQEDVRFIAKDFFQ